MSHEYRRHSLIVQFLVSVQIHHVEANCFALRSSDAKVEPRFIRIFEFCSVHIWRHDAAKLEIGFWSAALAAIHRVLVRQRVII